MDGDRKLQISSEIIKLAGEAGAKVALEVMEEQKKKMAKDRRDRRLRNTKLLLRNYRMLKAHCESAVYEVARVNIEDDVDIIDLMENIFTDDKFYVESIKRSAERTYLIMSHINEMLRLFELYCQSSGKDEDQRRYNTLYCLYICDIPMSVQDIADKECIDSRTVYRDVDCAAEKLSALIFGIDGIGISK